MARSWEPLRNKLWQDVVDDLFPAKPLGLVAARSRGHADAAPPLQQRHGLRGRPPAAVGRVGGRGRRELVLHRLRQAARSTSASIPPGGRSRSRRSTARWSGRAGRSTTRRRTARARRSAASPSRSTRTGPSRSRARSTFPSRPTSRPTSRSGLADPSTFGKEVVGTVLENVTISFCSRVAGYFRGDGLVIRNSLISDTSTEGIYVIGSSDVLLERNIIRQEQRRAAHRLLPGGGQDLQPDAPSHLPRQPGHRHSPTRTASGTTWATATPSS